VGDSRAGHGLLARLTLFLPRFVVLAAVLVEVTGARVEARSLRSTRSFGRPRGTSRHAMYVIAPSQCSGVPRVAKPQHDDLSLRPFIIPAMIPITHRRSSGLGRPSTDGHSRSSPVGRPVHKTSNTARASRRRAGLLDQTAGSTTPHSRVSITETTTIKTQRSARARPPSERPAAALANRQRFT